MNENEARRAEGGVGPKSAAILRQTAVGVG